VSKVDGSGELNSDVVDQLEVAAGHVHAQIELELFDVLVHVSAVGHLGHDKLVAGVGVHELVKCSYNVRVGLNINPFLDILNFRNFFQEKLLPEVLMVHDESGRIDDTLDLPRCNELGEWRWWCPGKGA